MPNDPGQRYHRQAILPVVGADGQARIRDTSALLVGCGALGTVIAESLARAGVGRLTIVDRDVVEPTNLQRQTLFTERDAHLARPKAVAARDRLADINSYITIHAIPDDLHPANAKRILDDADPGLILDGTDNFQTRYLLNDLAIHAAIPLILGGAVGTSGTTMAIGPRGAPCLRCVEPDPPAPGAHESCDTAGVLAAAPGVIANLQAAQALRLIVEGADRISTRLIAIDAWTLDVSTIDLQHAHDPDCPCCVHRRFDFLSATAGPGAATLCGRSAVQVRPDAPGDIDLAKLASTLEPHGHAHATDHVARITLTAEPGDDDHPIELTVFPDGRALIHHTARVDRARSIYARYIGL